ncbi:MAG: hypothetical protein AB7T22_04185 [Calditrichaceae bacterium]
MRLKLMILISIIFSVFIWSGCTDDAAEKVEDNVVLTFAGSGVEIKNNSSSTIGTFVVDAGTAEHINWAAICTVDNQISCHESKIIEPFIMDEFQLNDHIIVYFWECPKTEDGEIYSSVIR